MWGEYEDLVLHLLKELVGGVFIAILLHLSEVAFFWSHCGIDLNMKAHLGHGVYSS